VITFSHPVAVTKISISGAAFYIVVTVNPYIHACKAQIGST